MNTVHKFTDFRSVYESFEEIPSHRRLSNYEEDFREDDIWMEYLNDQYPVEEYSEEYMRDIHRSGSRWKSFSESFDVHHAFTNPNIVDKWCKYLLQDMSKRSAKANYLTRINKFYRYLVWHIDYPHTYNPLQYAVSEYKLPNEVWHAMAKGDGDD
ncbi:hypothetical protein PM030_05335 [Halorubrum ezzemoulense]|uniref:hypothetical protein n=1 Tax=Halorubrum ezzemoulense TaxID=337243 RepID=UPI0023300071|nr:hypothetical protein [Halorubrum ezzemoulense]MDB2281292.1 hypothetical protein [Halorubrum ezzemoulense]